MVNCKLLIVKCYTKSMFYLTLPVVFLQFWFVELPLSLIAYFLSLNKAFLQLFSLGAFIRTFFKPLKNEYRAGLVGFSIGMGMVVKTILIAADVLLFTFLLLAEIAFTVFIVGLPFITIWLLTV